MKLTSPAISHHKGDILVLLFEIGVHLVLHESKCADEFRLRLLRHLASVLSESEESGRMLSGEKTPADASRSN